MSFATTRQDGITGKFHCPAAPLRALRYWSDAGDRFHPGIPIWPCQLAPCRRLRSQPVNTLKGRVALTGGGTAQGLACAAAPRRKECEAVRRMIADAGCHSGGVGKVDDDPRPLWPGQFALSPSLPPAPCPG